MVENGRGVGLEKLAYPRKIKSQRYFEHQASYSDQRQSIGIVNVHERCALFWRPLCHYDRVCRASRCSVSYYNSR